MKSCLCGCFNLGLGNIYNRLEYIKVLFYDYFLFLISALIYPLLIGLDWRVRNLIPGLNGKSFQSKTICFPISIYYIFVYSLIGPRLRRPLFPDVFEDE